MSRAIHAPAGRVRRAIEIAKVLLCQFERRGQELLNFWRIVVKAARKSSGFNEETSAVVEDGEGEELPRAASLGKRGFGSSGVRGLSLSASCDSIDQSRRFRGRRGGGFLLVRFVMLTELGISNLSSLHFAIWIRLELFVPALLEAPDLVWLVVLALDSFEVV